MALEDLMHCWSHAPRTMVVGALSPSSYGSYTSEEVSWSQGTQDEGIHSWLMLH